MNKIFKQRKTVRSFSDQGIEVAMLEEILEAANSAPSAGNLKARDIIVVAEDEIKSLLAKAAFDQNQIREAPAVLVFVALPEVSAKKYGERGKNLYAIQDATLAAGFAWLQAVDLGLAGGWIGGFEEAEVKKILGFKGNQKPIAIIPIGYSTQ